MTATDRLNQHDKQIATIRALVQEGMKMVVGMRSDLRAFAKDLRALAAAQRRTEETLDKLMTTLLRGSNGHSKRKVDLQ